MATNEQSPLAIGVKEAAKLLSVSTGTIRNQIRSGGLPAVHIGTRVLVRPADVRKFVDAGGSAKRGEPPQPPHKDLEGETP